ncbi:hypothetical protein [Enterobacter ludwigii]|uniref:hypothetical protein n=1 Tax=Enterobacter ludwigii TaxID=299767 RepID=UPI00397541BD
MTISLLHRLKNKGDSPGNTHTVYKESVCALFVDLCLLFSSRPLLPEDNKFPSLEKSVLNYGIRIIQDSMIKESKELMTEKLAKNIVQALYLYERRLSNITISRYNVTAEKISYRVDGLFNGNPLVFIVSWETSVSSYSLDAIL